MKIRGWIIGVLLTSGLCGCYQFGDGFDEVVSGGRNRVRAQYAWWQSRSVYDGMNNEGDFSSGYRAGYRRVAAGGDGAPPTLPPRRYWSPLFQSQGGQQQSVTWFDGFHHGALAAQQDGVDQYSQIATSISARDGWMSQDLMPQAIEGEGSTSVGGEVDSGFVPAPAAAAPFLPTLQ